MTRDDLINRVSEKTTVPKTTVENVIRSAFDTMGDALKAGERVEMRSFGILKVKDTAARQARNPRTGAPVDVPAGKKVTFKASTDLDKKIA